jgi:hypothetical protein
MLILSLIFCIWHFECLSFKGKKKEKEENRGAGVGDKQEMDDDDEKKKKKTLHSHGCAIFWYGCCTTVT